MANFSDGLPLTEAPPVSSFNRIALILAFVFTSLACCIISGLVLVWLVPNARNELAERWPVSAVPAMATVTRLPSPTTTSSPTVTATASPTFTPSATFTPQPTATPEPTDTPQPTWTPTAARPRPVTATPSVFSNGNLETDAFFTFNNQFQPNLELSRWYLLQAAPDSRWIEQVDMSQEGRGFGLKSVDTRNCTSLCNVAAVQVVPAEENRTYTLSVEARKEPGSDDGILYLDFLDANRQSIEALTQQEQYDTGWRTYTLIAAAPPGTRYVRVMLYSSNRGQGVIYWDNVLLQVDKT